MRGTVVKAAAVLGMMLLGGGVARAQTESEAWEQVARALKAPQKPPMAAAQDGPPVRDGARVLFRYRAPKDAVRVYLAGSFNGWARNDKGRVRDKRFAMQPTGKGIWYQRAPIAPQVGQYKFVVETKDGKQTWVADPTVESTDADGNTVFDFATVTLDVTPTPTEWRALEPFVPTPVQSDAVQVVQSLRVEKVWVRPDQTNILVVTVAPGEKLANARLSVRIENPLGARVIAVSQAAHSGVNRVMLPALKREGGYIARVSIVQAGDVVGHGETVLSVVRNVADDLRYGFYASYATNGGDYAKKAALLANLHVNAVEFYDYFPAHGYYAPRAPEYRFEPFGTQINARDIQRKINAGHQRNILSLAYVAAYAASESVYRKHPYPMTTKDGVPKIFNGAIMPEDEADRNKKPKWFWLMNVAQDSPWHRYITGELTRALDDKPGDLVSFDGFEIDTYGDSPDTRFYAKGSKRNGDLLGSVLHDYVGDVQALTHKAKPYGLVSFNSVNEFAVENMYDVTDFLFLEIWHEHTNRLEDLVDICFRHRAPRRQRVVLKIYPADMEPGKTAWPAPALRRVLGAAMTGAGSLMVAGEPDETQSQMHGLNTLYYPDHQPLAPGSATILRDYYRHDALLLGYTHGRNVVNTNLENPVPDCVTRTYAAPDKHALVVQLLHVGSETRWSADAPLPSPLQNREITLTLPAGASPRAVFYASPDTPTLQTPVKLDFEATGTTLRTILPELAVHGTLILQY